MPLQLVNSTQARRLKKLGFSEHIRELYIINSTRRYMAETMDVAENWNKFDDVLSRPSIALGLEFMRNNYDCICEVIIQDWEKGWFEGNYKFDDMPGVGKTRLFRERSRAESELLTKVLEYKLYSLFNSNN